jgi:hypothetical protein
VRRERDSKSSLRSSLGHLQVPQYPSSGCETYRFHPSQVRIPHSYEEFTTRRERDSNPRYPFGYAAFPRRCTRPLCDLSIFFSLFFPRPAPLHQTKKREYYSKILPWSQSKKPCICPHNITSSIEVQNEAKNAIIQE